MEAGMNVNEELTFKELVLAIRGLVQYLWSKIIWIALVVLIGGVIGGYLAYTTPVTYQAQLTFMLNEESGGGGGGLNSILGQIGLGGGGGSEYNLEKIVELSKSNRIIFEAILDSASIDGQNDLIGNHLIRYFEFHEAWKTSNDPEQVDFLFTHTKRDSFSRTENAVLKGLYVQIVGDDKQDADERILTASYRESTGILYIIALTESEELSIVLANKIYAKLSSFYVSKSIEKQLSTLEAVTGKVDSINNELRKTESQLARTSDRSLGVFQRSDLVSQGRLSRNLQVLSIIYAEALKNKETASFVLSNRTPFLQVVDDVFAPLQPIESSVKIAIFVGVLLGGIIASIMFSLSKVIRDALG
jgi:uncharacterized protein involved in exopolysaccharide biosynthesis